MGGEIKQQLNNLTAENYLLKQTIHRLMEKPSLRDRFAMAALTGILSEGAWEKLNATYFARFSYEIADAMLETRGVENAQSS